MYEESSQDNRFRRVGVTHRIGKGFMMCMCFRMCYAFVQGLSQLRDVADVMCLWQDGRSKNRFSRPKEPIASPPPVKSDKVMRADGAWFYLTSEPPEAGTWIASNRNRLCAVMPVLYMLMSGGGLRQGGQYIYTEYVYNYIYIDT